MKFNFSPKHMYKKKLNLKNVQNLNEIEKYANDNLKY